MRGSTQRSDYLVLLFTISYLFCVVSSYQSVIGHRLPRDKYLSTVKQNWHGAAAFCRARGEFLVSINSQEQLDEVIEAIKESGYLKTKDESLQLWTSGNDLAELNQFVWTATGQRMTFNRWTTGEPNHGRVDSCTVERCVVLQHYENGGGANFSFDDRPCEKEYYFMCEPLEN